MAIAIPIRAGQERVEGPPCGVPDDLKLVIKSAQDAIARALHVYGVTEEPTFHPSCNFSSDNMMTALDEMQKHLGVGNVLLRKRDDTSKQQQQQGASKPVLKAAWVYCNTPQEVAMLSYLIREVDVEHLYLGVTVHLATSASGDSCCMDDTVGNDVAATCAAMELLLHELRGQSALRYLRLDFNVLANTCSPFEPMACRLLGNDAVCQSVEKLTDELRALLDHNTGIKTFKLGLHQRLYELFDSADMDHAQRREAKRIAVLLGKHDRAGARSPLADLPAELLQAVLDLAAPSDQSVEVLPLRK